MPFLEAGTRSGVIVQSVIEVRQVTLYGYGCIRRRITLRLAGDSIRRGLRWGLLKENGLE